MGNWDDDLLYNIRTHITHTNARWTCGWSTCNSRTRKVEMGSAERPAWTRSQPYQHAVDSVSVVRHHSQRCEQCPVTPERELKTDE